MTVYHWDRTTPGNNATADSTINWSEGQSPSSVNDSGRAMMTALAKYRDDINGTITTGGTSTAYTITSNQVFDTLAHMNGAMVAFIPHTNCGATVTLNVDGLGAKPLRTAPGVELAAGALIAGTPYAASYVNSSAVWYLQNVYNIPAAAGSITGSMIAAGTITYSNIQNVTNARLLGNFTGGAAAPSEYAIAGGLSVSGTTLNGSLAFQGGFKNLSIKVLTNTTVAVAADFVVMYDGTNTRTVPISGTIDMTTSAVVNGRDGTLAIDTWYYIWAISNGTTDGALASTSSTAPTLPSGYTFKARIGAVQTIHASTALYGTWQLGNRAQYVQGLAGGTPTTTTTPGPIVNGTVGTFSLTSPVLSAVTVTGNGKYIPTTASHIHLIANNDYKAGGGTSIEIAPSQSYSGTNNGPAGSNGLPFPYVQTDTANAHVDNFMLLLETTTISVASAAASAMVSCIGWIDNI